LAARYCAKEAVVKALSNFYNKTIGYSNVEILKNENGSVCVNMLIDELKEYDETKTIQEKFNLLCLTRR
jgi:phosphopantetheinyl transferase (holo-ACP synthase)